MKNIGMMTDRRLRMNHDITWNSFSGTVKRGRLEIGTAKSHYQAIGIAMSDAKKEKMWFEKSKKPSEVYWLWKIREITWESANMFIAPRGRHDRSTKCFEGMGIKTKIRNGKLYVDFDSVKTASNHREIGYKSKDAPQHSSLSFDLDEVFYPERQPPYSRMTILAEDTNGTKWDFTFYPENGK